MALFCLVVTVAVVQLVLGSLCHPRLRSFIHDAKSCYTDPISLWLKSGDMSHTGFDYGLTYDGEGGIICWWLTDC